jgi:hypothetical protein
MMDLQANAAPKNIVASYYITSESSTSNYMVVLEDEFGYVPLFAIDNFDVALGLVKVAEFEELCFTGQTEKLIALN